MHKRTFRVFICSTFEDMQVERRALHERVFPQLQTLCRALGYRFQPIDLRWGVPDALAQEHRTLDICFEEIRRCREISAGVHFLILLGDRYGWRPVPARISADEFEALLLHAPDRSRLLDLWTKDENAVPPEYRLLPRRGTAVAWRETENGALTDLCRAAQNAAELSAAQRGSIGRSATHQEIDRGLFSPEGQVDRVFAYFRSSSARSLDASTAPLEKGDSQERLNELKTQIERKIAHRVFRFEVRQGHAGSEDGLDGFCERVIADLKKTIESTALRGQGSDFDESTAHWDFARLQARHFLARSAEVETVQRYVREGGSHPLIVCGAPGSGKTALLARVALGLNRGEIWPIVRFAGATAAASELTTLLATIVDEIRQAENRLGVTPQTYPEAVAQLQEELGRAGGTRLVVVVLDGIDQLRGPYASNAGWLTDLSSVNVRVVVSLGAGADSMLQNMRGAHPAAALLDLPPLDPQQAAAILDAWLASDGRTLQAFQRQWVLNCFEIDRRPLSLRLAYEHARHLTSDQAVPDLRSGVSGLLELHFDTLRTQTGLGPALIERALSYLTAARLGLLEDESTAILSRDSEVMSEVNAMHSHAPPTTELPVVLWSRFFLAVSPFLRRAASPAGELLTLRDGLARDLIAQTHQTPASRRHAMLAAYFRDEYSHVLGNESVVPTRIVEELLWQCYRSGDRRGLVDALADLRLLQATYNTQSEFVHSCWRELIQEGVSLMSVYGGEWRRGAAKGMPVWAVGNLLGQMGEAHEASELTRFLVEHFRTQPENRAEYARALVADAQFLMAANRHEEAAERYRSAERILEQSGDLDGLAVVLCQLAGVQRFPEDAFQLLDRVEALRNRSGKPGASPGLIGNRANLYAAIGELDNAIALERQAIELAEAYGMTAAAADLMISLANWLNRSSKQAEALAILAEAETRVRRLGLLGPLAACLGTQANIHSDLSDYEMAITKNREAEPFLKKTGQLSWLAVNLFNQALLYERMGRRSDALAKARDLKELSRHAALPPHVLGTCERILRGADPSGRWPREPGVVHSSNTKPRRWWEFWM